jgi:hypothetical protein
MSDGAHAYWPTSSALAAWLADASSGVRLKLAALSGGLLDQPKCEEAHRELATDETNNAHPKEREKGAERTCHGPTSLGPQHPTCHPRTLL